MPIVVDNITYTYGSKTPFEKTAIKNISFTINEGDFIGIIGHTGSGKSTLVQHLNGLLHPTSGTVLVNHLDISAKTVEARNMRHKVGMVFQYPEHQLFEETIAKDIAFSFEDAEYYHDDMTVEDIQDAVEELLMGDFPHVAKSYMIYRYEHQTRLGVMQC